MCAAHEKNFRIYFRFSLVELYLYISEPEVKHRINNGYMDTVKRTRIHAGTCTKEFKKRIEQNLKYMTTCTVNTN